MMMVPSAGPHQGGPVPARSAMVVEQDYDRVNRPPASAARLMARRESVRKRNNLPGGLSARRPAVPRDPFRPGPAHIVQLRPIAIHKAIQDSPNEGQDIHFPTPPTRPLVTGADFGRLKGGSEAAI